jgi:DNA-binding NtrC family response regulator
MARVLVIDDDELIRRTARMILEQSGHSVSDAENGKRALEWLKENPVDLVLTDILMPDGDGMEIILAVRKLHPAVKIIAMSGSRQHDMYLQAAGKLGAHAVLDKPFRGTQLREIMRLVLNTPTQDTSTAV